MLRVTLHWCNGNPPISVKEHTTRCICACASNQARVWACVSVSLSSSIKSPVDKKLRVHVIKALLKVLKRGAPQDVCVFVHARSIVGMGVCLPSSLTTRQLLVRVCMYVYEY